MKKTRKIIRNKTINTNTSLDRTTTSLDRTNKSNKSNNNLNNSKLHEGNFVSHEGNGSGDGNVNGGGNRKEKPKKRKKKFFCLNCGKFGHRQKSCRSPITSAGILLYRNRTYNNGRQEREFLHICRKDSIGYVDFVRGKYRLSDIKYIQKLINMMTTREKQKILTLDFQTLWQDIWFMTSTEGNTILVHRHKHEYMKSNRLFNLLRKGYFNRKLKIFITLLGLINSSTSQYKSAEWGFPKGRRIFGESDLECGRREFMEETGIPETDFTVHNRLPTIVSSFKGQNMRNYKHIFFLAEYIGTKDSFSINKDNILQSSEISNIKWFTIYEAGRIFREYNRQKLINLHKATRILPKSSGKKSSNNVLNGKH